MKVLLGVFIQPRPSPRPPNSISYTLQFFVYSPYFFGGSRSRRYAPTPTRTPAWSHTTGNRRYLPTPQQHLSGTIPPDSIQKSISNLFRQHPVPYRPNPDNCCPSLSTSCGAACLQTLHRAGATLPRMHCRALAFSPSEVCLPCNIWNASRASYLPP